MSEEKQYAERDLIAMDVAGNHYCRHVSAMTREHLHSKSDIAAELGWRDWQIAELKEQRDALAAENAALKTFINQSCYSYDGDGSDVCDSYVGADESPFFPKTPATDTYLNAVRADFLPAGLHTSTSELVLTFAKALAEKLHRSEQKYGWSDGWKDVGWQDKCLADFHHHINKGDPRDVAAYCAFMWYHGWPTRPAPAIDLNAVRADAVVEAFVTVFDVCSRDDHIDKNLWNYGVMRVAKHADEYVSQLRAGKIRCWSCKEWVSNNEFQNADRHCIHCDAEIDDNDEPYTRAGEQS